MKLNLGCGKRPKTGWVNVDRIPLPAVNVVTDLDTTWPWPDGSVSAIEADNVFEHVVRPVFFMTECHRVLDPSGSLLILTPHMSSLASWTDPTHLRHCTEHSFDYWIPGNVYYQEANQTYGGVAFTGTVVHRQDHMVEAKLRRA